MWASIPVGLLITAVLYIKLLTFLTLPLAYRAVRGAMQFHSDTSRLIPTNATTILPHLANGLLLCLGYVVGS